MTEKQYRLNKWGTKLLKNDRPLFDWANESDDIVDLLNEQNEKIKELDKYCTACDDTLLTIQELTYKLLTIDFKDIEISFIHDCIKSINKCDLLEMEKLKREYGDVE